MANLTSPSTLRDLKQTEPVSAVQIVQCSTKNKREEKRQETPGTAPMAEEATRPPQNKV